MNSLNESIYDNMIIDTLKRSNKLLSDNIINLTNQLVKTNDKYVKLQQEHFNVKYELEGKKNIENKIFQLETQALSDKHTISAKNTLLNSLKESFDLTNNTKELIIEKYKSDNNLLVKKNEQIQKQLFELKNNLENIEKKFKCSICYTNNINTMLEPCGHLTLCDKCVIELSTYTSQCPICRRTFNNFKKIYLNL